MGSSGSSGGGRTESSSTTSSPSSPPNTRPGRASKGRRGSIKAAPLPSPPSRRQKPRWRSRTSSMTSSGSWTRACAKRRRMQPTSRTFRSSTSKWTPSSSAPAILSRSGNSRHFLLSRRRRRARSGGSRSPLLPCVGGPSLRRWRRATAYRMRCKSRTCTLRKSSSRRGSRWGGTCWPTRTSPSPPGRSTRTTSLPRSAPSSSGTAAPLWTMSTTSTRFSQRSRIAEGCTRCGMGTSTASRRKWPSGGARSARSEATSRPRWKRRSS
mmetsp:Transcript_62076/g.196282  ORF Transcript_62076/g.196282 Transcript_62076/m.196282 type:complete len:267 (+) Transcript_62076:1477-2277(+)